jgi:PIN domain nuclease of toxin-antitoxin system
VTNVDTHILVAALAGDLSRRELNVLSEDRWGISAIVLWELAMLIQRRRIELETDYVESILPVIHVWPIDFQVALQSTQLDFSGDPADELIAATSIVHGVPLLTRDKKILRSRLVLFA